jgi:hypothetical protein
MCSHALQIALQRCRSPGLLLWEAIISAYGSGVQDIGFYDDAGNELMIPDETNERHQSAVIRSWAQSVIKWGNIQMVRGAPVAVDSPPSKPGDTGGAPFRMLTYNSLTRAMYMAAKMSPESPTVQRSLQIGLKSVQRLRHCTPTIVKTWVRDYHNQFHDGSGVSFLETLKSVLEIERAWLAECHSTGVQVRATGSAETYEQLCIKYIQAQFPMKVQSYLQYSKVRSCLTIG